MAQEKLDILIRIAGNAEADLQKIESRFEKMGNSIQKWAGRIDKAIQLAFVAGIARGISKAAQLDQAMRNIQTVGRQSEVELRALRDEFIRMSTDITVTTDSAQNLATAFYDIQGAGFAGEEAMTVLEASTKAASAGLTDTSTAMRGITAVLNSYGLEAEDASHISDLMFRTVDRGVGSFADLAGAVSNVVPTAKAAGIGFDVVSAALATMSKQGFTFSESATSLNMLLSNLLQPSEALSSALSAMGYESGLALIQQRGLAGAMNDLYNYTGGSVDQLMNLIPALRGSRAILSLTGTSAQMFADDMAAMANAVGATSEAFAIQTQGAQAQFANFKNTLDALLITVGQSLLPILTSVMRVIGQVIQAIMKLPQPLQTIIFGVTALVVALGPLKLLLGGIPAAIHGVIGAIGLLKGALTMLMAHPIIAAIVLGTALGVGIFLLFRGELEQLKQKFINVFQSIKEAWDKFWHDFGQGLGVIGKAIGKIINGVKGFLGIGSPSKVFAEIGASMGQGMTAGFQKTVSQMTGVAATATSQMSKAVGVPSTVAGTYKPSLSVGMAKSSGISARMGIGGSSPVINVYPQGTSDQQLQTITRRIASTVQQHGV